MLPPPDVTQWRKLLLQRKQSGFALLEAAIAMAIIGLMITLAVKGGEMVENSRAKSLAGDFKDNQTALYGYQDRYNALPGDDREASARLSPSDASILNGNGNQHIEGALNAYLSESFMLWQHVRLAGFLNGVADTKANNYVPLNSSGGALGLADISAAPITGMAGGYIICSDNISGRLVKQLDLMMDDGHTARGDMRVSSTTYSGEAIANEDIVESDFYLACLSI
jgi:type II secretory pathway pseudopilin PulG